MNSGPSKANTTLEEGRIRRRKLKRFHTFKNIAQPKTLILIPVILTKFSRIVKLNYTENLLL